MTEDRAADTGAARLPLRRWVPGLAALLIPLIAVYLSPLRADTALVYVGLLPALVALPYGPRVTWATALSCSGAVFVGLLLSTHAWGAAVFMVVLAVGVAWSYTRGWQGAATYVATQGALAAIAAPGTVLVPDAAANAVPSAAAVAGLVLVGGAWVALVGSVLLHDLPAPAHDPVPRDDLITFAIILALALGIGTFVAASVAPGSNVWWVLLTVLVVLKPEHAETRRRARWRAGGTIVGGAVAALLVVTLGDQPGLLQLFGLLAAMASAYTYLRAPYAVFSFTLTMALILLMLPLERALRADLERVGYTVLAAALIVAASAVIHRLRDGRSSQVRL